ncbi:MAG: nucleoside recognition protein [Bacteroidetes Order II. Incertae sedis bacterium]|nr:nucleoside recognition protein [Bacteroidetes Order II. bacterium]
MMNYIWAGLIILSLLFALGKDFSDLQQDRYRNGQSLPVTLSFPNGFQKQETQQPVQISVQASTYSRFYGVTQKEALRYEGRLRITPNGQELSFAEGATLPEPLATIQKTTNKKGKDLLAFVGTLNIKGDSVAYSSVRFQPVRFIKLQAITAAALEFADTAVTLALSLIGVMALWLGLMQIAGKVGLIEGLVKLVGPIFRPLFPGVPKDHPAMGMIILNMAANMLGLGNAATPMGIKAMHELQKLNPSEDTATNDMVMFLALNTSSVQVVPPATLVALMGLAVNELFFTILFATFFSTLFGILAAKTLSKMPKHRKTDPGVRSEPMTA